MIYENWGNNIVDLSPVIKCGVRGEARVSAPFTEFKDDSRDVNNVILY